MFIFIKISSQAKHRLFILEITRKEKRRKTGYTEKDMLDGFFDMSTWLDYSPHLFKH